MLLSCWARLFCCWVLLRRWALATPVESRTVSTPTSRGRAKRRMGVDMTTFRKNVKAKDGKTKAKRVHGKKEPGVVGAQSEKPHSAPCTRLAFVSKSTR